MKPRQIVALVAASVLVISFDAWAWGRDGHQVIANLAQSRLSPAARKGVAALLHGATLASVSTEADNIRNSRAEHHGEPSRFLRGRDHRVDGPRLLERDGVQKPAGADRDLERTGRQVAFADQLHLIRANLLAAQVRR